MLIAIFLFDWEKRVQEITEPIADVYPANALDYSDDVLNGSLFRFSEPGKDLEAQQSEEGRSDEHDLYGKLYTSMTGHYILWAAQGRINA